MSKFLYEIWPTVAFVVFLIGVGDALGHPVWFTRLIEDYGLLVLIIFWAVVAHFRRD
mgnify:CR=1 FL=1